MRLDLISRFYSLFKYLVFFSHMLCCTLIKKGIFAVVFRF